MANFFDAKKTVSLLLLISMLLPTFVSCANDTTKNDDTNNDAAGTPDGSESVEAETLPPYDFAAKGLNYNGYDFRIFNGQIADEKVDYLLDDVVIGNIVQEAVYNRNMKVEELLNITISEITNEDGWGQFSENIGTNVIANDDAYDAIAGPLIELYEAANNSYILDLETITTLDTANEWWDQSIIDTFKFLDGKTFFLNGDINYSDDYGLSCLYFNHDLFTQHNLEIPYDAARAGEWDYDMLHGLLDGFYADLNGNGEEDEEDQYGYVANMNIVNYLGVGLDILAVRLDEENHPRFNIDEYYMERFSAVIDELCNMNSVVIVERKFGYEVGNAIFSKKNTLFAENTVESCVDYREKVDFYLGVLPMPKYDETQEKYQSNFYDLSGVYSVPTTNRDLDKTGYILDAMGYYSGDTIYPATIEKNVLVKGSHDQDAADMFKIIFDSKCYNLTFITNWGNWTSIIQGMASDGKNRLASRAAKYNDVVQKQIDEDLLAFGQGE